MKNKMTLLALYIPEKLTYKNVEQALGLKLKKGIESTYYIELNEKILAYTQFNVLTLINYTKDEIIALLKKLDIKWAENFEFATIHQDYPINIDPELSKSFTIDNEKITLKEYSVLNLIIVSLVISQSVALELYEQKLSEYYEISRNLIDESNTYSFFRRSKLSSFAKQLVLVRHDMLIDLLMLDKPNILWDNEDKELLYNSLFYTLELKDRFDVVEHKLNSIKDDIVMVMDLANHNHSSFLEWIIIILIFIEIIMGIMEWFRH
ncbi:RMD1 family protein [bacterium]|nr:RMD1 family protein [bacterium]MBU1995215.1 RMD1 family protein [bacterium]